MRVKLLLGLAATTAAVLCAGSATATAQTVEPIEPVDIATAVSADGPYVAFTRRRGSRFELRVSVAGQPSRRIDVPTRAVPFDVDLGPGPDGRTWAVYTRCSREAPYQQNLPLVPGFGFAKRGSGCRIYGTPLADARQREIGPSTGRSRHEPTIWRGRLAFVQNSSAGTPQLRTGTLSGRGGAEAQPGGPAGKKRKPFVTGLDLDARHLAFGWNYIKDDGGIGLQLDIRVDRTSAARGRLLATLNTEPFLWLGATAPSLDTGSVVWGYIGSRNRGSSAFRVVADGSSALTSQQISPRTQSLSSARSVLYADVSRPNLDSGSSCVGSSNDFEPDETIGLGCAIVRQPFVGE